MALPTYKECQEARAQGKMTPIHWFILEYEPMGIHTEKFRDGLTKVIHYVRKIK